MIARTAGKYWFVERVGCGGMGTVYRASDESLARDVAIKILKLGNHEPEVIRRFRAEAVTLARLSHPGIAVVHELYQESGDPFMVASLSYSAVLTLNSSRSRQPRWRNANATESGAGLGGGAFGLVKSDRTWLAIQTKDRTYVVRAARDIEPLARRGPTHRSVGREAV